ncbi:hypothetical protein MWU59_01270 [Flavobacteriaceae bacterium F08102]|nr:hypothetical protein [Flavobacteriaceae bacterium F08102]
MNIMVLAIALTGCSSKMSSAYSKLSRPEKTWVLLHPFKAKKAYPLAKKAIVVSDSLAALGQIDDDNNGGTYDAFKHGFWMAVTAQRIGKRSAIRLGIAHEKGNYMTFKKQRKEDGQRPDLPSSKMDAFNNKIGVELGAKSPELKECNLVNQLLSALKKGQLRVLLKDKHGNFLDCSKTIIPLDSLKNKWNNSKCIVPSNSY